MTRVLPLLLCLTACPADPEPTDDTSTSTELVPQVRFELDSGAPVIGQLVTTYDATLWWHSDPTPYYAVYDPAGFDGNPDHAFRMIPSREVVSIERLASSDRVPSYQQVLRDQGIVLEQSPLAGPAMVLMGNEGYHREEDGYGDFAWDLAKTDDQGRRYRYLGVNNEDYYVWDAEVRLPVAGRVVEVYDEGPDNWPGQVGTLNNLVGIKLDGGYRLYILHFRQGSIPDEVFLGAELPVGALLGRVGNSGVTLEPHLHVTLLWEERAGPQLLRMWSVPMEFADLYVSDLPNTGAVLEDFAVPRTGTWIASESF